MRSGELMAHPRGHCNHHLRQHQAPPCPGILMHPHSRIHRHSAHSPTPPFHSLMHPPMSSSHRSWQAMVVPAPPLGSTGSLYGSKPCSRTRWLHGRCGREQAGRADEGGTRCVLVSTTGQQSRHGGRAGRKSRDAGDPQVVPSSLCCSCRHSIPPGNGRGPSWHRTRLWQRREAGQGMGRNAQQRMRMWGQGQGESAAQCDLPANPAVLTHKVAVPKACLVALWRRLCRDFLLRLVPPAPIARRALAPLLDYRGVGRRNRLIHYALLRGTAVGGRGCT